MPSFLARTLIVALALAGLTLGRAPAVEPYDVHVMIEQTGPFAFLGAKQAEAYRAIEGVVNSTGIQGRQVRFVLHDTASTPQTAVQIATQLVARKVPVIIGPALAADCSAIFPLIEQNGPVVYCYSPIVAPATRSYAFRAAPALEDIQPVVVRYYANRGLRNIALLTATDTSGQNFAQKLDATLNRLEFRNVRLVAREQFAPTDISVAAQLARIKSAKPDVLLTFAVGTAFGTVLRGISDAGLNIPIYGSGANMNAAQLQQYVAFLPRELVFNSIQGLVVDARAPVEIRRQQEAFFKAIQATGLQLDFAHALTWDPTMIVIGALRKIGPDATAEQIHDYLEKLRRWVGIQGVYNFATGDQAGMGESGTALFRWNAAGADHWDLVATGPRL